MEYTFDIVSYVGAKPLMFGMTELQVEELVGKPLRTALNFRGEKDAQYKSFSIRYSPQTGALVEIGIASAARVIFRGIDLFGDKESFAKIVRLDSCPYELHGFVILLDLGITLSGFHDNETSQLAVTAFARGRWDSLKPEFKNFHLV